MKTITKLTAVALTLFASSAFAGKGGSNQLIKDAVRSGSVDAIIAEVERTEGLMCESCVTTVSALLEDSRYQVREVAAWWYGKRPDLARQMAVVMTADLADGDSIHVRNAADFLGTIKVYKSLPALRTAMTRGGLDTEAKIALVRAAGTMAHVGGNPILVAGMADADATVRVAAVDAWRDVIHQVGVQQVEPLLADKDATVRAHAATVLGAYHDGNARPALEQLVVSDVDPFVRRNAAYALGKIGSASSHDALVQASSDKSPIVRNVAKAAIASLK